MKKVTVVSLIWGDWYELSKTYLIRLRNGIQRNTSHPLEFICLSDRHYRGTGWNIKPIVPLSTMRNLRKLSIYNPSLELSGRVFICDLDVVIVGSLDDIFGYSREFCIKANHGMNGLCEPLTPDGDIFLQNLSKSKRAKIWGWLKKNINIVENRTKGMERRFYERWGNELFHLTYLQKEFPGQVISYKRDKLHVNPLPENARIVTFHGRKAKPHLNTDYDWMKEHWR